jgi:hypothetical protein
MKPWTAGTWTLRIGLPVVGLLCLAAASLFAYRSGCVFDGKQGYGDYAQGQFYDSLAWLFFFGGIGSLTAAGLSWSRRRWLQTILAMAATFIVGPLSLYLLLEWGIRGITTCKPS